MSKLLLHETLGFREDFLLLKPKFLIAKFLFMAESLSLKIFLLRSALLAPQLLNFLRVRDREFVVTPFASHQYPFFMETIKNLKT